MAPVITRTFTSSPGIASPFSSHALSTVYDLRPGWLSARRVMCSTLGISKLLVNNLPNTFCTASAISKLSGAPRISQRKGIFNLHRSMSLQPDLAG